MPVKFTRPRFVSTREIPAPSDPWDAFKENVEACRQRFRGRPVTLTEHLGVRQTNFKRWPRQCADKRTKTELNRLEPDDKKAMPNKVRYHKETYRLNKKTPLQVASKFGMITLRSFYYLNEQDGELELAPVACAFGNRPPARATPALLERVARGVGRSHPGRGACLAVTRARPDLVQRSLACGRSAGFRQAAVAVRARWFAKAATAGVAGSRRKIFAWSASPGVGRRPRRHRL